MRIYELICEADDAFDLFLRSGFGFVGDPKPTERLDVAVNAGKHYRTYFNKKRILFPRDLRESLNNLNRGYIEIYNRYFIRKMMKEDDYTALTETLKKEVPNTADLKVKIEDELGRLLGVEQSNNVRLA